MGTTSVVVKHSALAGVISALVRRRTKDTFPFLCTRSEPATLAREARFIPTCRGRAVAGGAGGGVTVGVSTTSGSNWEVAGSQVKGG